ncbi:MAG TPA: acylphosphatase [Alphaproteobacteria bacterium]|nr:acylphosphatase [Alphaproteobacteria bacterium]
MPAGASGKKAVQAVITGTVQGVWFRAWTVEQASARGLDGWVRNRRDGSVEAVFAGDAALVDDMIKACHRGPDAAEVAGVAVSPAADMPAPGFRKLPSA